MVQDMTSNQNTSVGCLSILHHFFCTSSVTNQVNEVELNCSREEDYSNADAEEKKITPTSPGIVARLMGLDWLPEEPNWVPAVRTTLASVGRSRSVNSINFWSQFDPTERSLRRVVLRSLSFRETPLESDNLLLHKELELKEKKSEMGVPEADQNPAEKTVEKEKKKKKKKKGQECKRRLVNEKGRRSERVCRKPAAATTKAKAPLKTRNRKEVQRSSEILLGKSKKVRFSRAEADECDQSEFVIETKAPSLGLVSHLVYVPDTKIISYLQLWEYVCKLTEDDMRDTKGSSRGMWKLEEMEEIVIEFGMQILEWLVDETVVEISSFTASNFEF